MGTLTFPNLSPGQGRPGLIFYFLCLRQSKLPLRDSEEVSDPRGT